jgi:hypothetical protein
LKPFELDRDHLRSLIAEFARLYENRPILDNHGGMTFNHSFAVWAILKTMNPKFVIESGVYRGHSTWLIEQACPTATLFCLDIDFSHLLFKSSQAIYIEQDLTRVDWSGIDPENTVVFFDDHMNALARLKELWWLGIRHAIFEDNWPVGEGDSYSMRQLFSGTGAPELQMSESFKPKRIEDRKLQALGAKFILTLGANQTRLVPPNVEDSANLQRRLFRYLEFPPVCISSTNNRGKPWHEGDWPPEALLGEDESSQISKPLKLASQRALEYGHICYVSLKQ